MDYGWPLCGFARLYGPVFPMTDAHPLASQEAARPKTTLIDEALAEVAHSAKQEPFIREVLVRYGPAYAKRARQEERDAYAATRATTAGAHEAALKAAHDAYNKAASRSHATGHAHGFWKGIGAGLIVGVTGACILLTLIVVPFNEQTRASTEAGVMVGVAATQQGDRPLGTCSPGERRPDGSVCGEPGR